MSALPKLCLLPSPADAGGLDQHVLGLAAIGAGVHAQRAADGAGNAEEKFQPGDVGRRRGLRHALVERRGAHSDAVALGACGAETARAQANDHARHAAVAHDQVGADAEHIDRKLAGKF